MRHTPDHEPILDYRRCSVCFSALSAAFAALADMKIEGRKDMGVMIGALRRLAAGNLQRIDGDGQPRSAR